MRGLPETQEERATSGGLNWFRGHTQREKNCHSGSEKATGRAKDGNESSQDRVTVLAGQGQPDWQADGALKPNDPAKTILAEVNSERANRRLYMFASRCIGTGSG